MSNSIALLALEAADGTVVLTSITLVFAMLVALCLIITVEGKIFDAIKNKKSGTKATPKAPAAPAAAVDEPESYARIRAFVSGLLEHMGIQAEIEITARDNGGVNVNLSGSNMGAVIGRRGETLDAIQHLTNYAVNRGSDKHMHISVDAESYRAKREESLVRLAEKMAAKLSLIHI